MLEWSLESKFMILCTLYKKYCGIEVFWKMSLFCLVSALLEDFGPKIKFWGKIPTMKTWKQQSENLQFCLVPQMEWEP